MFKLNESIYNYENLINYKKEEAFNIIDNKDNTFFHKLYLTNNICESINAKLLSPKKRNGLQRFFKFNNKGINKQQF